MEELIDMDDATVSQKSVEDMKHSKWLFYIQAYFVIFHWHLCSSSFKHEQLGPSNWIPRQPILELFKMVGYFPNRPHAMKDKGS